jgi:hypothetical protein
MSYKPTHANGTFTKFGAPEIEKLYNDRYRIVVRCNVKGVDSKWHYSNVDNFWKDFGSLYESPLHADGLAVGWEPAAGETYPNMRLVKVSQNYPRTPNDGAPVLEFIYETLTGSYVQDADDKVDHELNGLRRVTRTVIATEDSSYAKLVGTATINHTGRGYGYETLTLASEEEVPKRQNEGGFTRIQETWVASGILNLSTPLVGGQQRVEVSAINLTSAEVGTLLFEVTANHELINESVSDYEGIKTSQYTFEVDDFEIRSQTENGLKTLERTQLGAGAFSDGAIGTDTYSDLTLTREQIDNSNTIKKRVSRYSDVGVLAVQPVEDGAFSLAPSYIYTTVGLPASLINSSEIFRPDGVTELGSDVTWFEPTVQNVEGFPTYTQYAICIDLDGEDEIKVHSQYQKVQITEPGVMSCNYFYENDSNTGAAGVYPQATQMPRTYRKNALVEVFLTTDNTLSSPADDEVAYTEEGVDWCNISFRDYYYSNEAKSSSSSASWRSFPNYLNSAGTTANAGAEVVGKYAAIANSYGDGDTTYVTTGIHKVKLEEYLKAPKNTTPFYTQYYLKTIVSFPA